jgi:hypothetical protein
VPMDWSFKTASPVISAPPALRATVRPRRVRAGRPARIRVRVTDAGGLPVRRASIRLRGRHKRTGRRGNAAFVTTFAHPGRVRVRVSKPGYRGARPAIVVRRARHRRHGYGG